MRCEARKDGPHSVSARAATLDAIDRRALPRSQRASMRRRQNLGWKFRPERAEPTRWASVSREARGGVLERTLGRGSRAWMASEGGDHRVPSLYCRLCRVKTRMVVGKFRFSIRVSAVTTLITHKVCSASRLAADITFFTSHVDPFKVVRLSEFKSKKSMTMRENSARTSLIGTELRNVPHDDHTNRAHCPLVPGHAARRSPFTVIQS
jgi:hypothetical protein